MSSPHNVVQLGVQRDARLDSVKLPVALVKLRDRCAQHFGKLLNRLFDQIDDSMFNRAERAGSNLEQNQFFDAMREIRLKKAQVVALCIQGFTEDFRFPVREKSRLRHASFDAESLSLIQNETLEQQVAADNMIKRARAQLARELEHLTLRLDASLPGVRVDEDNNPLGPDRLVQNFMKASTQFDIDIQSRLVLYKLFEKQVLAQLPGIYDAANKYLIEQGIMPDLRSVRPSAGRRNPIYQSSTVIDGSTGAITDAPMAEDTFEILRQLLSGTLASGGASSGGGAPASARGTSPARGSAGLPVLPQQALIGLLSTLQGQGGLPTTGRMDFRALVESALAGSPSQAPSQVGALDQDVMNLVGMLFEYILSDRNLQPQVKALIGRLQIPILKVALLDRSFFSRDGHPARRLLNEMASSAMGWSPATDGGSDPFLSKLEAIVDRLINHFEADLSVFEDLLQDFLVFAEGERKRRRLVEQRTRDAEIGRAKSDAARRVVQDALNAVLQGASVPALTLKVLTQGWSSYMVLLYLKQGEDHADWARALTVAEDLVAGTGFDEAADALEVDAIQTLVAALREGLQQTAFQPFELDALLNKVEALLMETSQARITRAIEAEGDFLSFVDGCDEAPPAVALSASVESLPLAPEETTPVVAAVQLVEPLVGADGEIGIEAEWLARAESFQVGCWVEFRESEEKRFRARLAAVIQTNGKYLFVNRMGVKVAEHTQSELAMALKGGTLQVLDDSLLFDRALQAVIGNLRHGQH